MRSLVMLYICVCERDPSKCDGFDLLEIIFFYKYDMLVIILHAH